jgi:endonuclease/exonuclease/phosphatase family metal-dependent hydrolase
MDGHNNLNIFYHPLSDIKNDEVKETSILKRNEIRILNYNIFIRPPLIKNNEDDWKDERLDDFIKEMHNYDIICLQEMFSSFSFRKLKLISEAVKQGFFFYVESDTPSMTSMCLVDGGLLILSRFPIVNYCYSGYSDGVDVDQFVNKGALYAQIRVRDSNLHLFVTHLQASYVYSDNLDRVFFYNLGYFL